MIRRVPRVDVANMVHGSGFVLFLGISNAYMAKHPARRRLGSAAESVVVVLTPKHKTTAGRRATPTTAAQQIGTRIGDEGLLPVVRRDGTYPPCSRTAREDTNGHNTNPAGPELVRSPCPEAVFPADRR
jgi:hypothetical protein